MPALPNNAAPFFTRIWSATAIMALTLLLAPNSGVFIPLALTILAGAAAAWSYYALRESWLRYLVSVGMGSTAFFALVSFRNFYGGSAAAETAASIAIGIYVLVFVGVAANWPRRSGNGS